MSTESQTDASDAAKKRRAKQTLNNLLLSLLATSGLVLLLVLAVPRDDSNRIQPVDYKSVAADVVDAEGLPVIVPKLPSDGWWSNSARWNAKPTDGVKNWYVGFVGPKNQYIGLTQAFDSNPTWLAFYLKGDVPTGTTEIAGTKWIVYETTEMHDPVKTKDYALVTEVNKDQILLYGTASKTEFEQFASKLAQKISEVYPSE